jgi:hypothetical protein
MNVKKWLSSVLRYIMVRFVSKRYPAKELKYLVQAENRARDMPNACCSPYTVSCNETLLRRLKGCVRR